MSVALLSQKITNVYKLIRRQYLGWVMETKVLGGALRKVTKNGKCVQL